MKVGRAEVSINSVTVPEEQTNHERFQYEKQNIEVWSFKKS